MHVVNESSSFIITIHHHDNMIADSYATKTELKNDVKRLCMMARRNLSVKLSNQTNVLFGCKNCAFCVSAEINEGEWVVTTRNCCHTCEEENVVERTRHLPYSPSDVAEHVMGLVRVDPDVQPKVIQEFARANMVGNPVIAYHTAHRARDLAINMCFGDPIESFEEFAAWNKRT